MHYHSDTSDVRRGRRAQQWFSVTGGRMLDRSSFGP